MVKLAVVGSRTFSDYDKTEQELNALDFDIEEIVSGGAKGADAMAAKYARKHEITLVEFLPKFKQYKHPYHHRNRLIAEYCDMLLAFWNGSSSGTKYTINYARKIGKEVIVIKV